MRTDTPQTIYRKDYTAPGYLVDTVELGFDLDPERTIVANRMTMRRNEASPQREIELYGENLFLVALRLNGKTLGKGDYRIDGDILRIAGAPDEVTLEIETITAPVKNTTLNGLYVSNGNFFTQ
ncbi:MAG TPA: aminopeptidase N, partial [Telluria sp.]